MSSWSCRGQIIDYQIGVPGRGRGESFLILNSWGCDPFLSQGGTMYFFSCVTGLDLHIIFKMSKIQGIYVQKDIKHIVIKVWRNGGGRRDFLWVWGLRSYLLNLTNLPFSAHLVINDSFLAMQTCWCIALSYLENITIANEIAITNQTKEQVYDLFKKTNNITRQNSYRAVTPKHYNNFISWWT